MNKTVVVEKENHVGIVRMNRPDRLNALDKATSALLVTVLEDLKADDGIRAVILTGEGRGFCSGADVAEMNSGESLSEWVLSNTGMKSIIAVPVALAELRKPTIAAMNGIAAGAGASLALACDIRIASTAARLSLMFVKRGLMPDCGATYFLPRLIGHARALELMFSGDVIGAEQAERIGLVNKVVEPDRLMEEAKAMAARLAAGPPLALRFIKEATGKSFNSDLRSQVDYEIYLQSILAQTEDHREGVKSFLEKRLPEFRGR